MATLPKRHDEEVNTFAVPDEGTHQARFMRYDDPLPSQYKNRDGEYPLRIKLVYKITQGEFEGEEVSCFCDFDLNALNKNSIYHHLTALDPDAELTGDEDLDDYIGKRCTIKLVHKASKKNPDRVFANIVEVSPAKRKPKPAAEAKPKPKPADDTWDEESDEDAA